MRRIRKFIALSYWKKLLFLEALMTQLITGFMLKILTFKRITRIVGNPSIPVKTIPQQLLFDIGEAVRTSGHLVPWKNKCMVSSLAARRMLNRRGIPSVLSLGVSSTGNEKMSAHAWLTCCSFEITPRGPGWQELHSF